MTRSSALAPPRAPGWRRLLELRPSTVDFQRRGFRTEPAATRQQLEAAARAFLDGYHAELAAPAAEAPDLSFVAAQRRGFAAEGAAMAATLRDALRPLGGTRRAPVLHGAFDDRYAYLLHVGAGWALAKLRRRGLRGTGAHAPLLRWLAYDGMGFCDSFFARRGITGVRHPARCAATCEIRHQGVGRALWFRACGDPAALAEQVSLLPPRHHGDAWSGIGLAATYAGGAEPETYDRLLAAAAEHRPALAQGSAFAAEARLLSGVPVPDTETVVRILTGVSPEEASAWTWAARRGLDQPGTDATGFRTWRLRIQATAATRRRPS